MNLLVTGGLGFIGSNFIRHILNKYPDYKVINLDSVAYCANFDNVKDLERSSRYGFVKGDIADQRIVDRIMRRRPDIVVNFAAQSHVDRSILYPQSFVKTDILGTQTLLDAARKYKIGLFLQVSTDKVYGSIADGSFDEESLLRPSSPYAASKAAADLMTLSYFKTYGLPVIITRSSNNFGPFQYPEKLIPLFITNLLENKKVPLYGDGRQTRDWIYVLDNCSAIDFVMHCGKIGQIYNIGGGNERTNLDITKFILGFLRKSERYIVNVKDRPGHDRCYSLNSNKMGRLGWRPKWRFEKALPQTIQWYIFNKRWWQKIKTGQYLEYYKKQYLQD